MCGYVEKQDKCVSMYWRKTRPQKVGGVTWIRIPSKRATTCQGCIRVVRVFRDSACGDFCLTHHLIPLC